MLSARWPGVLACGALVVAMVAAPSASSAPAAPAVVTVASGIGHSCAVTAGGRVKCWGRNSGGQLGDGTTHHRTTPVNVVGLGAKVTSVSTGAGHSCALTVGGGVKCWGRNFGGQLGDGTTHRRLTPVDVVGLAGGVTSVSAGGGFSCAVTNGGGVKCWGHNSGHGQLGDGTTDDRLTPVDVVGLTSGVTSVSTGGGHSCAVTSDGGVKCWGYNWAGQLGDGTTHRRLTPVEVVGLTSGVTAITAGNRHTCALTTGGGVKCWGYGSLGALGDGHPTNRSVPVDVVGLASGVAAITAGRDHTCALTTGSGVKCWGYSSWGALGDGTGTTRYTPVEVVGQARGATTVSAGSALTCSVRASGEVRCWGANDWGALGDGTRTDRWVPVTVRGLPGTTANTFQPDLRISLRPNGPFSGNNVYNTTGTGQTRRLTLAYRQTASIYLRLETDGNHRDIVFVESTAPRRTHLYPLYDIGASHATTAVRDDVYWTRLGRTQQIRMRVTIRAREDAVLGHRYTLTVTSRSSHNPAKLDTARILVTIVK